MSHRKRVKENRNSVAELERRIRLCKEYKSQVANFLTGLNDRKKSGLISTDKYLETLEQTFGEKNPIDWIDYYDGEIRKTKERIDEINSEIKESRKLAISKALGSRNTKILAAVFIILLMMGIGVYMFQADITGFVVSLGGKKIEANYTSGYDIEGSKWADIKGERMYERCMKVSSEIGFDAVIINAKITAASDTKDLVLSIYSNSEEDEPGTEIGNCEVDDYSSVWKSCSIDDLAAGKEYYWLCAYSPAGDIDSTYYTIAYENGGSKKRALWTGDYWQKLERASYTIKSEFIKWEE